MYADIIGSWGDAVATIETGHGLFWPGNALIGLVAMSDSCLENVTQLSAANDRSRFVQRRWTPGQALWVFQSSRYWYLTTFFFSGSMVPKS
jgi:hypothetical protein